LNEFLSSMHDPDGAGDSPHAGALPPSHLFTLQLRRMVGWSSIASLIDAPKPELYDLRNDAAEMSNRIHDSPQQAEQLRTLLRHYQLEPATASTPSTDPAAWERLRALGYAGPGLADRDELPLGLPDPKDRLGLKDLLAAAEEQARRGDQEAALASFDSVLKSEPQNRYALLRSAVVLVQRGSFADAIRRLALLVRLDARQAEARYHLADALTRSGQVVRAAQQWKETVRLQPRRAAAWSNLGAVLLEMNEVGDAVDALSRAVDLAPHDQVLRENLAEGRYRLAREEIAAGHTDAARAALDSAVSEIPRLRQQAAADPRLAALLRANIGN
jgi:Flp pilus assembly protein TadD